MWLFPPIIKIWTLNPSVFLAPFIWDFSQMFSVIKMSQWPLFTFQGSREFHISFFFCPLRREVGVEIVQIDRIGAVESRFGNHLILHDQIECPNVLKQY